jgi:hypothetical protein
MAKGAARPSAREIARALQRNEDKLADAFWKALRDILTEAPRSVTEPILKALYGQHYQEAVRLVGMPKIYAQLDAAIEDAALESFKIGAGGAELPGRIAAAMTFTLTNPRAMEYVHTRARMEQLKVREEIQEGVRQAIRNAFAEGGHPYEIARKIRAMTGLSQREVNAVENYRRFLDELDKPLIRPLSDEAIKRLRRAGVNATTARAWTRQGLTAEHKARLLQAYKDRMIRDRAKTIARTLVIDSSSAGQNEAWSQAADQGLLDPNKWEVKWIVAHDERLCPLCSALDGERRSLNGSYEGGIGRPPRHPNCRCSEGLVKAEGVGRKEGLPSPIKAKAKAPSGTVRKVMRGPKAAPAKAPEEPVIEAPSERVSAAVERMESSRGNYVSVDEVRRSVPEATDMVLIRMAEEGKLILGAYDGPKPIPPVRRHEFIFDEYGNIYIAVARPRSGG